MKNKISGVILAGGTGRRLNGLVKPNIVAGGKTILSRITEIFDGIFDEIIIVTSTPEQFKSFSKYRFIGDKITGRGPLGGIHSALNYTDSEALFIVAGDMPLLSKELIIRQLKYFSEIECDILIPRTGTYIEPLHGIYSKKIKERLELYLIEEKNYAIREFFKKADVKYFDLTEQEVSRRPFTNINSPEDIISLGDLSGS
jgi:molybdenum cofactor guanylyltransferase